MDSDDDEIPTLVAFDERNVEQDKPEQSEEQTVKPAIGKQFERQVPVTLITGYLGVPYAQELEL